MISKNLKRLMKERKITVTVLADKTGCSKAAISQYANGINTPSYERLKAIAEALNVTVDELEGPEAEVSRDEEPIIIKGRTTLTTKQAARLLHKNEEYIRRGLRENRPGFEFGSAVKTSKKWSYCIYANKFAEVTGIPVG